MKKSFLIIIAVFAFTSASAFHIIGGEIYYTYIGTGPNNLINYKITLKLYRNVDFHCDGRTNCLDEFEDPVPLYIFYDNGADYNEPVYAGIVHKAPLSDSLLNPCLAAKAVHLEVAFYEAKITLPASSAGFYVVYQRCCRGEKLANIYNSEREGSTLFTHITGTNTRLVNNSAYFNKDAAIVICKDKPLQYDYSGYDPDGDSLSYHLCSALAGGTQNDSYFSATVPPPYDNHLVNYIPPYSGANPMGGNPRISIDPKTGELTGTPGVAGSFVVTICIDEYDRQTSKLLGVHSKDILLTVFDCGTPTKAVLPATILNCGNGDVHEAAIPNNSSASANAIYYWQFGDGTDTITQSLDSFYHNFPDTGKYQIKMVINQGFSCADSTGAELYNYPGFRQGFTVTGICAEKPIVLADTSIYPESKIIGRKWDFGFKPDAGTEINLQQSTLSLLYPGEGFYNIILTDYAENGCVLSSSKNIQIYQAHPSAGNDTILVKGQHIQLQGSGGGKYFWIPPFGLSNDTIADPQLTADKDIIYLLEVTTAEGCVGYDSLAIKVFDKADIYVPTAFTPNSDGINDLFRIFPAGYATVSFFEIFDRWGRRLFYTQDYRQGWNGDHDGRPSPMGTYVWIVKAKTQAGTEIYKKGTVTLIR